MKPYKTTTGKLPKLTQQPPKPTGIRITKSTRAKTTQETLSNRATSDRLRKPVDRQANAIQTLKTRLKNHGFSGTATTLEEPISGKTVTKNNNSKITTANTNNQENKTYRQLNYYIGYRIDIRVESEFG